MGADDPAVERLRVAVRRLAAQTRDRPATGLSQDDADETVGTAGTDDAVGFDPFPLLGELHRAGATVSVIGQVAGIMNGSRESTGDLDLLWDADPRQLARLAAAFRAVGATLADNDGNQVACTPEAFNQPKVAFRSATACGDCCTTALPWGDLPVARMLERSRVAVTADGVPIRYLGADDLIRMRRAIGRPKDLRRADELERLSAEERLPAEERLSTEERLSAEERAPTGQPAPDRRR